MMNAGLPCNLTRGLMHLNAPLWLRTKSFTVSTFFTVYAHSDVVDFLVAQLA